MAVEQLLLHIPALRRYARLLTGDATGADDLVQDTLERACRKWSLWRPGTALRPWLLSIMHNLHLNQLRDWHLDDGHALLDDLPEAADPGAPAGDRGADDMRFLAVQPKKMISFDWNAPPSLPEVRQQRTFVVVRFAPLDDRTTRVTLHHTGWGDGGEWDKAYAYFDRAWGNVLGNLKQRFAQGPMDWTPWLQQLHKMRASAPN